VEIQGSDMSSLALELDYMLRRVDFETARRLERAVRDALEEAEKRSLKCAPHDALGYPIGYFESTAGSFAGEPLDVAPELPMQPRESW
jgi:hypothetical protein